MSELIEASKRYLYTGNPVSEPTTAAPGTEPRAYHLRPESELIEAAKETTDPARRERIERIERRAWELYMRDPSAGTRQAISDAIHWYELCQELIF